MKCTYDQWAEEEVGYLDGGPLHVLQSPVLFMVQTAERERERAVVLMWYIS